MKRIRIKMLATVDQLQAATTYHVVTELACLLIAQGKAVAIDNEGTRPQPTFQTQQIAPSETKPVQPAEMKKKVKRNA